MPRSAAVGSSPRTGARNVKPANNTAAGGRIRVMRQNLPIRGAGIIAVIVAERGWPFLPRLAGVVLAAGFRWNGLPERTVAQTAQQADGAGINVLVGQEFHGAGARRTSSAATTSMAY